VLDTGQELLYTSPTLFSTAMQVAGNAPPEKVVSIASASKWLSGTVIMTFVDEGKIIAVSGHSPLDIRHAAGQGDFCACAQFVARDNAGEATMNTSTTTMETAAHAGRGFCLGGPTRSAHHPAGLRPPDGEQAANQRRTVSRPESKFLSFRHCGEVW